MAGMSPEDRIGGLERQIETVRGQAQLRKDLQDVEVFVRKLQRRQVEEGPGFSTYTSACTSACFSSAACLCPGGSLTGATQDPEVAGVFATLHRRGIEVLGEEGFMDAIIAKAREVGQPPISPFVLDK
jgi:hypothetical protein